MHAETAFEGSPHDHLISWWDRCRDVFMKAAVPPSGRGHHRPRGRGFPFGPGFGPFAGFGGPPWFPGPGPRVGRGDVRTAILFLLAERPMHGYQVIQELTERSGGMWQPSPGSIYPTLQQLEDEGLVRSAEDEGRRVYSLTDEGRAEVERRTGEAPPWEMRVEAEAAGLIREEGFGLAGAVAQVVRGGSPEQVARAKEILAEARKSLYRLLAEDEPPSARSNA
jgi:DNA-binding PadR family transcriptional regulator